MPIARKTTEQRVVDAGLQDPEHDEEHADRRQDRSDPVERTLWIWRDRVDDTAAEHDDRRDHQGLEDERGSPADPRGDQAADQRSGRGTEPCHPADHTETPWHAIPAR